MILIGMIVCILIGCGKNETRISDTDQDWKSQQIGFVEAMGQNMTGSPYGYYFLSEDYLYFAENDFSNIALLCNKPDCLHNKETDPERKRSCNAYFRDGMLSWYDNNLYIVSDGKADEKINNKCLYRLSKDGQEQEKLLELGMVGSFTMHQGKLYTYEKYYNEEGKLYYGIQQREIDNLKNQEELYIGTWKDGSINYITCKDQKMSLSDFSMDGKNDILIDLETKEIKHLFTEYSEKADLISYMAGENGFYVLLFNEGERIDNKFYIHNWDGEKEKELNLYEGNDILAYLDDQYYYCYEVPWAPNAKPESELNMYVYNQDGKEVAKIPIIKGGLFLSGSKDYAFVKELEGGLKFILDKKKIEDGTAVFIDISDKLQ